MRRTASASTSIGALAVAALLPKCPLCIAAALSALGLGATVGAWLAPLARPALIALSLAALLGLARSTWRRRPRRCPCS